MATNQPSSLLGTGAAALSSGAVNTALTFRRIYGINNSVNENLAWSDENTLAYIAGHSIVLYNRKDKKQRFINFVGTEVAESITAYTSGNVKRFII